MPPPGIPKSLTFDCPIKLYQQLHAVKIRENKDNIREFIEVILDHIISKELTPVKFIEYRDYLNQKFKTAQHKRCTIHASAEGYAKIQQCQKEYGSVWIKEILMVSIYLYIADKYPQVINLIES